MSTPSQVTAPATAAQARASGPPGAHTAPAAPADSSTAAPRLEVVAPAALAAAFAAQGYTVHRAPSDWVIDRRARLFAQEIATGHATAALAWERRGAAAIEDWIGARRAQAADGVLSVRIGHQDLLALPPA